MKFIKKNVGKLSLIAFTTFLPIISWAQADVPANCDKTKGICNPIGTDTINEFVKKTLDGVLKIGIPVVALAIIYCGFLFVSARGNNEKLTKAKSALLYTIIGAAILLGGWAIAQIISETVLSLY